MTLYHAAIRDRQTDPPARLGDPAVLDRDGNPPPSTPPEYPNPPAPEPMSRYGVGYLTGYRSGIGHAISVIEPLVEDDPENAVPRSGKLCNSWSNRCRQRAPNPSKPAPVSRALLANGLRRRMAPPGRVPYCCAALPA